jgi:hypothetical protein
MVLAPVAELINTESLSAVYSRTIGKIKASDDRCSATREFVRQIHRDMASRINAKSKLGLLDNLNQISTPDQLAILASSGTYLDILDLWLKDALLVVNQEEALVYILNVR